MVRTTLSFWTIFELTAGLHSARGEGDCQVAAAGRRLAFSSEASEACPGGGLPGVQRGKFSLVAVEDQKATGGDDNVAAAQSRVRCKMFDRCVGRAVRRRQRRLAIGDIALAGSSMLPLRLDCRRLGADMRVSRRGESRFAAAEESLNRIARLRGDRKSQRRNCGAKEEARVVTHGRTQFLSLT